MRGTLRDSEALDGSPEPSRAIQGTYLVPLDGKQQRALHMVMPTTLILLSELHDANELGGAER